MFNPDSSVFGIFQGGWVTILVLLSALGALYAFVRVGAVRLIAVLMAALVIYDGFEWSAWPLFRLIFWIIWIAVAVIAVVDLVDGTEDGVWRAARSGGVATTILAIVFAANLPSIGWSNPFSEVSAMRTSLVKMDETARNNVLKQVLKDAAQDRVDAEQNKRLDALEASDNRQNKRLDALETKVAGIQSVALPDDVDRERYYDTMSKQLVDAGWTPGDFVIGTVDWSKNPDDAGSRAFVKHTLTGQEQLRTFLNGSSAKGLAAKAHILAALPASEHSRALSGQGFVPMQFNTEVCLDGNTYFLDARAMRDGQRCHSAGDITWIYVAKDGTVYWDASVRADCGNPGMTGIPKPKVAKTRKATPTSRPTSSTSTGSATSSTSSTTHPTSSSSSTKPTSSTSSTSLSTKKPGEDGGDSGQNENTGTDDYVDPTDAATQQPPETYSPPVSPTATATSTATATESVPEPSAPDPTDPATGTVTAPGR